MSSPLGLTTGSSAAAYSGSNHALALHHVFGLKGDVKDNIQYVEESEVVYPCGRAIVAYNIEKKSQRFIHLAQPSNPQQQQQNALPQISSPSQPNSPTSAGGQPFSPSSTSAPSDLPPSTPSLAAQASYGTGPSSSHVLTIQESGAASGSAIPSTAGQITAMALSNSKTKLLAVAESSDRGLIWVYDAVTHKRKTKVPLQCPEMGSHEWVSLAFSPDGKQLLALGGAPDWLLVNFLWERGKPLQMAQVSNQNGAAVYQCSYCPLDPTCVCVTGQGILRFLRLEQNDFKSIQFNIGKREPQNYLCHAWMEDRVLIGTDTGDILVFENGDFFGVLASSPANGKSINSIAPYTKGFVCGCDQGVLHVFERDEKDLYKRAKSFQIDGSLNLCRIRNLAISPSEDNVACTLDNCQAFVFSLSNTDILKAEDMNFEPLAVSFHVGSITGLDVCMRKPLVVTCGSDRSVRVWNYLERSLELVKFFKEEPLSVAIHPSGLHLLVGFSDCLALLNLLMEEMRVFREFPVKQCREVRFSNGGQYFAIANGAVVQLFSTYSCEPIGNLRGHKARIRSLAWSHDDSALVSTDSEGQMYEWRLKEGSHVQDYNATTGQSHSAGTGGSIASPSHGGSAGFASTAAGILSNSSGANGTNTTAGMALGLASLPRVDLLSAVHTFEGSVLCCGSDQSLRLVEQSKEKVHLEAAVFLTQLALPSQPQNYLFAGTEAGAVRAYELPLSGKFSEYQCHSAPVTRIRVSPDEGFLFTVSEDGCLSIFELDQKDPRNAARRKHELALPWAEEILVTRSDLEKKMSLVSELKSRVEDLQQHNAQQLKMREANYQDKLKDITAKFNVELEADRKRYEALEHDKSEMEARYHCTLEEMENRHRTKMGQLEQYHTAKIKSEENRLEQLEAGLKASRERRAEQHQRREEIFSQELEEQQANHRRALQLEAERRGLLSTQKDQLVNEFEETKTIMEDDADKDIDELKAAYDQKLAAERLNTLRLQDENAILKKKFSSLNDDIKEQKESIKKRETRQRQLYDTIRSLEKDVEAHMKEIQERESTIADKVKRIFELRKKNQELEKFKFVLDYKIKELKRQIAPRQSEIRTMADQIAQMTQELNGYKKDNAYLLLHVKELKLKLNGLDKEISQQKRSRANLLSTLKRLRSEVGVVQQYLDSPKQLKEAVKALYDSGVTRQENGQEDEEAEEPKSPSGELDDTLSDLDATQTPGSPSSSSSNGVGGIPDAHSIYYRQRTYLERSIDSLHSKLEKELEVYRKERARITQENIALITEINTLRREIQMMKQAQFARETERRVKKEKKTAKGKALLSTAPVGSVLLSPAGTSEMKSHTGNFAITSPGASSTSSAAPLSSPAFTSTLPSARGRGSSAAAASPTAASVLAATANQGSAKAQAMRKQIEQQQQVLVTLRKQLQHLSSPPGFTVGAVTATPRSPHSPHSPHPPSARKASSPVPIRTSSPVS